MSAAPVSRARALLQSRRRRSSGFFLAEGAHVIDELLRAGLVPREAFVVDGSLRDDAIALVERLRAAGVAPHVVDARVLRELADTRTPQGIVAVVAEPTPPPRPFDEAGLWLLLDRVQDPGNAGTLLRAAEAFGARGVVALQGTVDLWAPRTVRSGQGAHAHLHLIQHGAGADPAAELGTFLAAGGELWAAETGGDAIYAAPRPPARCMLAVGNEAGGLADDVLARATRRVAVPQHGRTESLNVAMAATVLLSWLARDGDVA